MSRCPRCSTTRRRLIKPLANGLPAAAQVPAAPRARRRDRVGEEPDDRPDGVPRGARDGGARAADPGRADGRALSRTTSDARSASGVLDFEDMLGAGGPDARRSSPRPRRSSASGIAAFTVDEFQDVNPLQAALLDRWLGGRDELCVVGDDYQTIFALHRRVAVAPADFPERFPQARVVRLEENYRSTPQVLALGEPAGPEARGASERSSEQRGRTGRRRSRSRSRRRRPRSLGSWRRRAVHEQGVPGRGSRSCSG